MSRRFHRLPFLFQSIVALSAAWAMAAKEASFKFTPSPGSRNLIEMSAHPSVQKEIGLSEAGRQEIAKLMAAYAEDAKTEFQNVGLGNVFQSLKGLTGDVRAKGQVAIAAKMREAKRTL